MLRFLLLGLIAASPLIGLTPEKALHRLQEGNERFVNESLLHPGRTEARRLALSDAQSPYAVIVTCSDSRVIPEVIFDEGLGDLFVIRVAGNVIGATELESIHYAVMHLSPAAVVVMGHEQCGAIKAVLQGQTQDIPAIGFLAYPAVEKAKEANAKDPLQLAIELNAQNMCSFLQGSEEIAKAVEKKQIALHAAYYDMQTGRVKFFGKSHKSTL